MGNDLFIDVFSYRDKDYPFQLFIGGRGTGKTYSALRGCLKLGDHPIEGKFLWMRRTQNISDMLLDAAGAEGISDVKQINSDFGTNYGFTKINDNINGIYLRELDPDKKKYIYQGEPVGYGVSLNTMANIRGVNFSDCSDWVYDEFVPERHVRKIRDEGGAWLQAVETINRNREFFGAPPVYVWLLSNADDIYNPIFVKLGIVNIAEKMKAAGKIHYYDKKRGLALHILPPSDEFKKKKADTALYKLTAGTDFFDMALNNEFAYNDFSLIAHRNLKGFIPMCSVDSAYIYKKKGDSEIYITYAEARTPEHYNSKLKQDEIRFRREVGVLLHPYYVNNKIVFESYELKEKLLSLIM